MCLEFSQVVHFTVEIQVEMEHLDRGQVTGRCGKVKDIKPAVFALSRKEDESLEKHTGNVCGCCGDLAGRLT